MSFNYQTVAPTEIIVVDNASLDDRTQRVALEAGVRYVHEDKPGLDIARNTGAAAASCPIAVYALLSHEHLEQWWTTAPRSYFASGRDHRRWKQRFAGKPLSETTGAFRVRVTETPRAFRRWHVEIVIGAQRFSLSSHHDREAAELDARLFGSMFDPEAWVTPKERRQMEALRGDGTAYVLLRPIGRPLRGEVLIRSAGFAVTTGWPRLPPVPAAT
jgi:glycosyltransferase involved in cell wall biosynthesis